MLICMDCHESFPESWCETVRGDHSVGLHDYEVCPYCRSDDLMEATYCDSCGDPYASVDPDDGCLCEQCRAEALEKISAFIHSQLTPSQGAWAMTFINVEA